MPKVTGTIAVLLLLATGMQPGFAVEESTDYAVQVSARVSASPPQITLSWPQDNFTQVSEYLLYRKAPASDSWGTAVRLPGTATTYVDHNVRVGIAYEYQIVRQDRCYNSYGYIYSGIEVPMTESRGRLLLVLDETYVADLATELAQLEQDLTGDGWLVSRLEVKRNDSVQEIKHLIQARCQATGSELKCVFLFGHVPVPYSGNIVPDGHGPAHQGAWPCDGYYADRDGVWTDESVNETRASDVRNHNVPGDGKFDQSTFPAPIKLIIGRVDLANMPGRTTRGGPPTFPSECELLRNYLDKDHNFRVRQFNLPRRGLVGDYFGAHNGEAFAASGWRNFSALLGAANVTRIPKEGTWISVLSSTGYLWAYGCGPGTYESIASLGPPGTTAELVHQDLKAAFVLLYGSWLGDWDSEDNLLRSVLASPTCGLACAWSGRPHWFLHSMGLGETIGFGARLTQNNGPHGLYRNEANTAAGQIHIALMGDPTLRLHVVAPPRNLSARTNATAVTLRWTPSEDSVLGYHLYRAASPSGPFTRATTSLLVDPSYTDRNADATANYMVRALKLETSASGTYFNLSQGAFLTPAVTLDEFPGARLPRLIRKAPASVPSSSLRQNAG